MCQPILPHTLPSCTPHFEGHGLTQAMARHHADGLAWRQWALRADLCPPLQHAPGLTGLPAVARRHLQHDPPLSCGSCQVPMPTRENSLKVYPRPNVPTRLSLSSPLSCVLSATCRAHTTAMHFCVVVCGVDGLFSASAYKPLEGKKRAPRYLFFVSSMASCILLCS